ncbi:hypothetical protein RB6551 [Rhodopirellula baltica SH 1]|uniref:Uncharacterized protein n=1 Tax=Rhodopirellula baltica (strain DSM 10527 / NCIMB 13988 / SH1) TaxID=243090 RepID=Q7UQ32_RHOBA|nr:hypothetical protein RB6551 [Rhodopirellula baltica SH 1]
MPLSERERRGNRIENNVYLRGHHCPRRFFFVRWFHSVRWLIVR